MLEKSLFTTLCNLPVIMYFSLENQYDLFFTDIPLWTVLINSRPLNLCRQIAYKSLDVYSHAVPTKSA